MFTLHDLLAFLLRVGIRERITGFFSDVNGSISGSDVSFLALSSSHVRVTIAPDTSLTASGTSLVEAVVFRVALDTELIVLDPDPSQRIIFSAGESLCSSNVVSPGIDASRARQCLLSCVMSCR